MFKFPLVVLLTATTLAATFAYSCVAVLQHDLDASYHLSSLLALAKEIPSKAEKTLYSQQNTSVDIWLILASLQDKTDDFRRHYDNKPSCSCSYQKAINIFNKAKRKIEVITDIDHVPKMKEKFNPKFAKNVEYIQNAIDDCNTPNQCKDQHKKVENVKGRLMKVHEDWCRFVDDSFKKDKTCAEKIEGKAGKALKPIFTKLHELKRAKLISDELLD